MLSKAVLEFMKIFTTLRETITSADILISHPAVSMLTACCRLYYSKYTQPTAFVLQNLALMEALNAMWALGFNTTLDVLLNFNFSV